MQKHVILAIILIGIARMSCGQTSGAAENAAPFSFEASYVGDAYANLAGGLQTGAGYMGMANLKMGFDTGHARWWKGGSFFINGASIHGRSLSEDFGGDLQVASNIDAGTHVYVHELWFRQTFSRLSLTIGLQDLNAEFLTGENAGQFINSSFGVPPVVSSNVPVPIFPLTGLGVAVRWNVSHRVTWQSAVFDGCQKPFEHNPYNLHWNFSKDDGVFAVTEWHAQFKIMGKEGIYKVGAYYHSGLNEWDEATRTAAPVFAHNYGCYLIADQTVWTKNGRTASLFTQIAVAPKSKNESAFYLGLGAVGRGIFRDNAHDALGIAVAYLHLHRSSLRHETAIEVFYKWQINDNFAVQPDVQYIIHPAGTGASLRNALVSLLRINIDF